MCVKLFERSSKCPTSQNKAICSVTSNSSLKRLYFKEISFWQMVVGILVKRGTQAQHRLCAQISPTSMTDSVELVAYSCSTEVMNALQDPF